MNLRKVRFYISNDENLHVLQCQSKTNKTKSLLDAIILNLEKFKMFKLTLVFLGLPWFTLSPHVLKAKLKKS